MISVVIFSQIRELKRTAANFLQAIIVQIRQPKHCKSPINLNIS